MLKELQDFGLSEKEAKVYLASLEIGKATADKIAKHAGVNRSTTYVQIESLMKKGLMSTYKEDKRTCFAPESPENLERILEEKKTSFEAREKELERTLPDLTRLFESAGERPIVRFFNGKDGITAIREEILTLPRGSLVTIIYSSDALENIYTTKELLVYATRRSGAGIKVRALYTSKEGPLPPGDIVPLTERRFISYDRMPISSDFYIYGNRIAVTALRGKIFGVIVESKEITESLSALFTILWEQGA